jgi:hypothetical protein
MIKIYEVKTQTKEGRPYASYNVAATTLKDAIVKAQKLRIDPYSTTVEFISEVRILAQETQ